MMKTIQRLKRDLEALKSNNSSSNSITSITTTLRKRQQGRNIKQICQIITGCTDRGIILSINGYRNHQITLIQ